MEYILTITKGYQNDYEVTLREEGNGYEEHDYFRSKSEKAVVKFINKITTEYNFGYHNLYPDDYMLEYLRNCTSGGTQEWNIYSR